MTELSPIELFKSVVAEERWTHGQWHRFVPGEGGGGKKGGAGRHYLCLAAAWGKPGDINSVNDCPTDLFPAWLFEMMPFLDDSIGAKNVPWLFMGFGERAENMAKLSAEAWQRIQTGFMIGCARQALESAAPVQPDPKPAYWQPIVDAVEQVAKALQSGDPAALSAARSAARSAAQAAALSAALSAEAAALSAALSAEAAARSAEAAALSAEAAARSAARSAEAAARSAARSAEAAALSAIRKLAELLFAMIDAEIGE